MRRSRGHGGFFLTLLLNLLLNLDRTVPAWILLGLHFWRGWSIGWFWLALGIWALVILAWTGVLAWASRCGSAPEPRQKNRNPYSASTAKLMKQDDSREHHP